MAGAYYIWFSVANLFMISLFWSLMVDMFTAAQATRLVALIAAGGSIGAAVMAVWPFAHAPAAAMCLALAVEGAGMVLVMVGAYRRPASETLLTWVAFTVAGVLDLPALGQHAPRLLYVYPAFFVVMGAGVLLAAAFGAAHAARVRAVKMSAQRPRYYPRYRHRSLVPAQAAAHQPRGRERPEESRERAR